jgi:hypothetical protein
MQTDGSTSGDDAGDRSPLPAPALPAPSPVATPVQSTVTTEAPIVARHDVTVERGADKRRGARRGFTVLVALVLVAGLVAAMVLLADARGDRQDYADSLAQKRSELDAAREQIDELEGEVKLLETDIAAIDSSMEAQAQELATLAESNEQAQAQLASVTLDLQGAVADDAETEQALTDMVALSLVLGVGIEEADAECMAEMMVGDFGPEIVNLFVESASGNSSSEDQVGAAIADSADGCGVEPPEEVLIEQGTNYGDNPTLDRLYDQCAAGDGAACDDLYATSDQGTAYEQFGYSCGNRFFGDDVPVFCEGSI